MNLTGIISISGKPGLYRVIAQSKNSIIVESLDTNKRTPAYSTDRISAIEDISIYTYEEDVPLKEVFKAIFAKENGGNAPSHKEDVKVLEKYLLSVLPNYDQERVYISDVRKIFQWYNKLNAAGLIVVEEAKEEAPAEEKPKKAPAKKAEKAETPAKESKPKATKAKAVKEETAEKPKKATATKKKKED
ncbi:MAG TPA: DUF5606 domain-containing protein [Crocinitomicaceae bacterium]|nr:DUF5606 domain-containing protein [Crocinitomicaceae bacterium]